MARTSVAELEPLPGWRYGIAVISVLLVAGIQLVLKPLLDDQAPFLLYLTDIFIIGWYCGFRPALLATVLSVALVWVVCFWPQWQTGGKPEWIYAAIISLACALVACAFSARLRMVRLSLDARKDWYAATLNGVGDGVITCDGEGSVTYLNERAELLTGWSADAARGVPVAQIARLREDPAPLHEDSRILVDREGGERHVIFSVQSIFDLDGNKQGDVRVIRDVSEQHRAQSALLESERRFRLIFDAGLIGIYFAHPDGRVIDANDTFLDLLGLQRNRFDADGLNWMAQTHADFADLDRRKLQEVLDAGGCEAYDKRFVRLDNEEMVWAMVVACKIDGDEILVFTLDITQRKRMEQDLRRSENEHRALSENVLHMVWMADPGGRRYYFNRRWYEYTGLHSPVDWPQALHPDDVGRGVAAVQHALDTGSKMVIEKRYRRHDGAYRWHLVQMVPIRDGSGEIIRWYGTCTDVEDQKRAMLALRETARRTDEFIATLSHELRNPLTTISMCAHLLARTDVDASERGNSIESLLHQSGVLTRLIDDLLDLARITSGKLPLQCAPLELGALLARIVQNLVPRFEAQGVVLQHEQTRRAWIFADAIRVQQIIDNLLLNALRFSPRASAVTVELVIDADSVRVVVRDHGRGLAVDDIESIFEPFVQGEDSHHGLGLGLTIARRLAALHDGTLHAANNRTGGGAVFTLELPAISPPVADGNARPPLQASGNGKRVLIIEDEQRTAAALGAYLRLEGHQCRYATNAEDAVREAASFRPQVVICDIALEGSLDGLEVARQLRAQPATHDALLIAFTGYGRDEDTQRLRAAGFDEHMVKPASPQALCALVARGRAAAPPRA